MFYLPGRIPVRISGGFWLVAAFIGFMQSQQIIGIMMWVIIILVSVLFHEMGHAYIAKLFNQKPSIALVPFGGATTFQGKTVSLGKQFLIVLNGPLFGFLLFFMIFMLRKSGLVANPFLQQFFYSMESVNLIWSAINLFPVLPMDGGQLLRIAFEGAFGVKGLRASVLVSTILAGLAAFASFAVREYFLGSILFFFAFQSLDMWIKSKNITSKDRDRKLAALLEDGEHCMRDHDLPQAEKIFQSLRSTTKKGILYIAATQYLAFIEKEKGEPHLAYELLLAIKGDITPDAVFLLQELAFLEGNYPLVTDLAVKAFEQHPSQLVALRNARAFGFLEMAKSAGGWLQTALEYGLVDKAEILSEEAFSKVRHHVDFLEFFPEK